MASFYKCIRGDSSDCNMSSTRIMDSKLREAEGFGEDNSGKKKSKFKSFKKFFGKRKRKETLPSMGTSRLKPCQSTSDVMASESAHISYDSEDELENHKGVMGSRALSHDSIFIPEAAQEPCRRVRVFSQENISDRIRTLQLKLQHNLKLGPPPPPSGILVKRVDDAGASSEDDGLPRSPPEMSLIHEVLGSNTTRFSDSHKHLSSLSLAGTGSEEEEQVTSGPSSRPRSTEGQLFPKHESAKTRSPRTSDSSISPAADFDTPPKYSTCLDNSAAKHKLLIKPRNQRSSRMQRFSLTQSESLNDLSCTPEEEEHDGREILTDLTDEILNTSHQDLSGSTALNTKPPLPKKPILQNITNSNKEKQENGIKSPESRNEDRDLEKKLSPPQVPEKSVPSLVMTADSGRRIDSESKPAWITIARQKQRGMQQEQELNTEEKLVVQDMKSETEKANQEKERTEGSVKQQTDSIRNKFSDSATTSEEQRKETKSDVKEPLPRASFLSHHVSEEISQCKKASHSAPDQPSWMELAKKKSQAWNDMPRIIK
ncbi:hypothetical protein Y1Q_0006250 [Alligator mississippiensis]|uniref:DUF4592 domain-containing protein n=1 Tax=Alligator mississippiensis TaxID=8496 RepID=A0A151NXW2_ALLMI|nr:hypothetical protein Y1Q_0006250 [Alligator mississippiensis]